MPAEQQALNEANQALNEAIAKHAVMVAKAKANNGTVAAKAKAKAAVKA